MEVVKTEKISNIFTMEDAYINFVNELMDKLWQTLPSVIEEKCLGCRNAAFDHDICSLPDRELLAHFLMWFGIKCCRFTKSSQIAFKPNTVFY